MKSASKTMYTVGKNITIIGIICLALFLVLGILSITNNVNMYAEFIKDGYTKVESAAQLKQIGIMLTIFSAVAMVVDFIVLAIATRAQKALKNNEKISGPHTWMLIIGILGQNIFYILGSIFGLVTSEKNE